MKTTPEKDTADGNSKLEELQNTLKREKEALQKLLENLKILQLKNRKT